MNRGMRLIDRGDRGGRGSAAPAGRGGRPAPAPRHPHRGGADRVRCRVVLRRRDATSASRLRGDGAGGSRRSHLGLRRRLAEAADGDHETARRRMWALLGDGDLEALRRPDLHMPASLCLLAYAASVVGDREAAAAATAAGADAPCLVLRRRRSASVSCRSGTSVASNCSPTGSMQRSRSCVRGRASGRAGDGLGERLHTGRSRQGAAPTRRSDDPAEAESCSPRGSARQRYRVGWAGRCAAEARTEIEGRTPSPPQPGEERSRPLRALATRGGRRALAAMVGGLDDADLEHRFAEPRRQRALVRAMARSFQPGKAGGFSGTIAYELEPLRDRGGPRRALALGDRGRLGARPGAPGRACSARCRGHGSLRARRLGAGRGRHPGPDRGDARRPLQRRGGRAARRAAGGNVRRPDGGPASYP